MRVFAPAAATLLMAMSGCGHTAAAPAPAAATVQLNVTNRYELPMDVLVEAAGTRYRLGVVAPGIDRSFDLPAAALAAGGRVEFLASPSAGGAGARSGVMVVSAGSVVDFVITAALFDSRAIIRR